MLLVGLSFFSQCSGLESLEFVAECVTVETPNCGNAFEYFFHLVRVNATGNYANLPGTNLTFPLSTAAAAPVREIVAYTLNSVPVAKSRLGT